MMAPGDILEMRHVSGQDPEQVAFGAYLIIHPYGYDG
jgi:hypothetical protein